MIWWLYMTIINHFARPIFELDHFPMWVFSLIVDYTCDFTKIIASAVYIYLFW